MKRTKVIKALISNESWVNDATQYYINLLLDGVSADSQGFAKNNKELRGSDIVLTVNALSALKTKIMNPQKKIVTWFQGVGPEESAMFGGGYLKYLFKSGIEFLALKFSDFNVYVSDEMVEHYKTKYNFYTNKSIVIPCFNKEFKENNEQPFQFSMEPDILKFVYAGGLQPWQCVKQTLLTFKSMKTLKPNSKFTILTKDIEKAESLCLQLDIDDVEIKSCKIEELNEELRQFDFGFVFREKNIVNYVATPTKINSYLSAGVIPIFTSSLLEMKNKIPNSISICVEYNEDCQSLAVDICNEIDKFLSGRLSSSDYDNLFVNYYNSAKYKELLSAIEI